MMILCWQSVKIAEKSDHEKFLNLEFTWSRYSLSQADTVSSVSHLIDQNIVRESITKMKNGKAAGPSGLLSGMIKAAGEI